MLKKILKGLLVFFLILQGVGVYFYFFPKYEGGDIPDLYFHSLHREKIYESIENGYQLFPPLIEFTQKNSENINSEVIRTYLFLLTEIADKPYILGNYENDTFVMLKNLVSFHTKIYEFLETQGTEKEKSQVYLQIHKSFSRITQNADINMIDAIVIFKVLDTNFDKIQENELNLTDSLKNVYVLNLKQYEISNKLIENALKREYETINTTITGTIEASKSLKKTFFYNQEETKNILKNQFKDSIEQNQIQVIPLNGNNFIGRTVINVGAYNYQSLFKKQSDILQKHLDVINLLSN